MLFLTASLVTCSICSACASRLAHNLIHLDLENDEYNASLIHIAIQTYCLEVITERSIAQLNRTALTFQAVHKNVSTSAAPTQTKAENKNLEVMMYKSFVQYAK